MGTVSTLRALAACLLVGSAALAQQGLITEPWPKAAAPLSTPVAAPRPMPDSGLPSEASVAPSPPVAAPLPPAEGAVPVARRWTPPVVTLLVDPWKRPPSAPSGPRLRWLPPQPEIVDPWARERTPAPQRVASRPAEASRPAAVSPRSTIF